MPSNLPQGSMKMTPKRDPLGRRAMLKAMACGTAFAGARAPMLICGRYRVFAYSPVEYSARAIELVRRSTVIDMLSPLTLNFPKMAKWFADPESFTGADLQPFKDSGIHVFHIGIGLGGPEHLGVGSDIDLYGYDAMPPAENKRLRAGYKGSYGLLASRR